MFEELEGTFAVVGRFARMPEGEYFLMTPDGAPTKWTREQADDIVAQNTPTQEGAPELKVLPFAEWCGLLMNKKIVSDKGLRLLTQPREGKK